MTKRDYIEVAAVLHAERQAVKAENVRHYNGGHENGGNTVTNGIALQQANRTIDRIEASLCDLFYRDNPRFDHQRFLLASGGDFK